MNIHFPNLKSQSVYVAFSGGVDSTVLLHLACLKDHPVTAIHINHGFQKEADQWAHHCQQVAKQFGANFQVHKIEAKRQKHESFEAFAREQRYQMFHNIVHDGTLLVGHHADDQAETLLLQLMRGAGPKGLSAMPSEKFVDKMRVCRPLLSYTRVEIERYAKKHHLNWIEDSSNQDIVFKRNAIRKEIMPMLKKHFLGCLKTMSRSAELCAELSYFSETWAHEQLLVYQDSNSHLKFKGSGFENLKTVQQNLILRAWFGQQGLRQLNQKHLVQIHKLIQAENYHEAKFEMKQLCIVRNRTHLMILKS